MGKVILSPTKYKYLFVEYMIIKKYGKINLHLLEKAKELVKQIYELDNNELSIKKSDISFIDKFDKLIERSYGDLFKDHPWIKDGVIDLSDEFVKNADILTKGFLDQKNILNSIAKKEYKLNGGYPQ